MTAAAAPTANDTITCRLCGAPTHAIQTHLQQKHEGVTMDNYKSRFPDDETLSPYAKHLIDIESKKRAAASQSPVTDAAPAGQAQAAVSAQSAVAVSYLAPHSFVTKHMPLHELLEVEAKGEAINSRGQPIPINVFEPHPFKDFVPSRCFHHFEEVENAKDVLLGLELNKNVYVYGFHGTGKTSLVEQLCARTNRPLIRVQHSIGIEESHIVGQWTVKGGQTVWNPGLLQLAMRNGWVYLADEWDIAQPGVLSIYRPVLEGKALVIKEADDENRITIPHPAFRFIASGNTNGSGDETGMYQGTMMQAAPDMDRFPICIEVDYLPPEVEAKIVAGQARLNASDADKLVAFANKVREAYKTRQMTATMSLRPLIDAGELGVYKSSLRKGLQLSFLNKLSRVDRGVAEGLADRILGH
ncbi:AAA family ATPase [Cupriavidus metallidurans]|uniref:AAA family ATPase n=1 Tax=Cupriavidus metallidurans TaxID=119219 RepID=UPI001CCD32E2|nr:MoxR family ATPase [Cupriavidus metallidurans]UBM12725.1 MoxR family ATPase [Cupriavidus metallidurans]